MPPPKRPGRCALRLALPSAESGPVIVQHESHGAFGHCAKATGNPRVCQATRSRVIVWRRLMLHAIRLDEKAPLTTGPFRFSMPPRTLASLAHALTVSADADAALAALGEALVGSRSRTLDSRSCISTSGGRCSSNECCSRRPEPSAFRSRRRSITCRRASGPPSAPADSSWISADSSDEFARLFQIPSLRRNRVAERPRASASTDS